MDATVKVQRRVSSVRNALHSVQGFNEQWENLAVPHSIRDFVAGQIVAVFKAIRQHSLGPLTSEALTQFEKDPGTVNHESVEAFIRLYGAGE